MKKIKNKIMILRKIGDKNYIKLGDAKFKDDDDLIKWKNHQIPKPPKNPYTFSTKKVNILFFDIDNKEYITFGSVELGLSTNFLDSLFNHKIVMQLAKAVKKASEKPTTNWDFIKNAIIYGVIFLVGFLLGQGGF